MATGKFVTYLRVSTDRQGASGWGVIAQRKSVSDFLIGGGWSVVAEHVEVESGKIIDRPELVKAIAACRLYGAKLCIARIDRLSRDAHFLHRLEKAGVDFVAADMPAANPLTVGIMAMIAEGEHRMMSKRTKDALAAAKARGVKLGGYRGGNGAAAGRAASLKARRQAAVARAAALAPILAELRAAGATSLGGIAKALTERVISTARGGVAWTPMQVSRVLGKLG